MSDLRNVPGIGAKKEQELMDEKEKQLFLEVHDMHRDDNSNFSLGWNQAVGHIEKRITELLGVDLKSASEELE